MTTIEELQSMDQAALVAWLLEDSERDHPRCVEVYAEVLAAAKAGELPADFAARWMTANREAARRLLAEADQLGKYSRCRKARISNVVQGGKQ